MAREGAREEGSEIPLAKAIGKPARHSLYGFEREKPVAKKVVQSTSENKEGHQRRTYLGWTIQLGPASSGILQVI